ncbi:MAG: hypothetical protein RPT25_13325 [Cycloclasticus sp.]
MSQFVITKQDSSNSVDVKGFARLYGSAGYCLFVKGNYIVRNNDAGGVDILLGVALFDGCRVDKVNFAQLDFGRESLAKLSGRFIVISVIELEVQIISSIFGSFPCFMSPDCGVISSNQRLISQATDGKLSMNALRERIVYYTNYKHSLFEGVRRLEAGVVANVKDSNYSEYNYLSSVIKCQSNLSLENAIKGIKNKMEANARAYFTGGRKASVSYTGGRDSRLLLCQLLRVMPVEQIHTFTVGYENDLEYFVGDKFTRKFKVEHDLLVPELINTSHISEYVNQYENINFPCLYKDQVRQYLETKDVDVLNSNTPETVLCHLDYFEGQDHPAVNFVRKRRSIFEGRALGRNEKLANDVENAAVTKWKALRKNLPTDISANILFSLTTIQRDWAFNILRPFDLAANTVCIMEDPEIISILSSIDRSIFLDDNLYQILVKKEYPELHVTPTTRDIGFDIFKKMKVLDVVKNIPLIFKASVFAGSLSKLLKNNKSFIVNYCRDNQDMLVTIFGREDAEALLHKLDAGVYLDNRFSKLLNKILFRKKTIREYELITPLCAIALLNNNYYE